jgi:hypothetical protein
MLGKIYRILRTIVLKVEDILLNVSDDFEEIDDNFGGIATGYVSHNR